MIINFVKLVPFYFRIFSRIRCINPIACDRITISKHAWQVLFQRSDIIPFLFFSFLIIHSHYISLEIYSGDILNGSES